jgi:hypothetical protein
MGEKAKHQESRKHLQKKYQTVLTYQLTVQQHLLPRLQCDPRALAQRQVVEHDAAWARFLHPK